MEESITGSPGGLVMSGIENSLLQPVHLLFRPQVGGERIQVLVVSRLCSTWFKRHVLQTFYSCTQSQGPAQMQRRFISLFGLTVAVALLGAASRRQSSTILQQRRLLQQRLQQLWDFPYGGAPGEHPMCRC